jgi:hypothetical protein
MPCTVCGGSQGISRGRRRSPPRASRVLFLRRPLVCSGVCGPFPRRTCTAHAPRAMVGSARIGRHAQQSAQTKHCFRVLVDAPAAGVCRRRTLQRARAPAPGRRHREVQRGDRRGLTRRSMVEHFGAQHHVLVGLVLVPIAHRLPSGREQSGRTVLRSVHLASHPQPSAPYLVRERQASLDGRAVAVRLQLALGLQRGGPPGGSRRPSPGDTGQRHACSAAL